MYYEQLGLIGYSFEQFHQHLLEQKQPSQSMVLGNEHLPMAIFLNQPRSPFPPFFLPVRSNTANMANAVIKDGNPIDKLINTCINLIPCEIQGQLIW